MPQDTSSERRVNAYNRMMKRVQHTLARSPVKTPAALAQAVAQAEDQVVARGELNRDEAQAVGESLQRDLEDAGAYLAHPGSELRAWLHFDLELIEERLRDLVIAAADQTKLAFLTLTQRAQQASEYHTGNVVGVGTLQCVACGELLYFHSTGHIPPCPKCRQTRFVRKPLGDPRPP